MNNSSIRLTTSYKLRVQDTVSFSLTILIVIDCGAGVMVLHMCLENTKNGSHAVDIAFTYNKRKLYVNDTARILVYYRRCGRGNCI